MSRRVQEVARGIATADRPADYLLTVKDVAARLQVDPQTVYRWVWSGHLAATRIGPKGRWVRFRPEDVEAFLGQPSAGNRVG